jgi:Uma2 family endonuclease
MARNRELGAVMTLSVDRATHPRKKTKRGEPPWDIALLYPPQGAWTEEQYLALDNSGTGMLIELVDGFLEVLPVPDLYHQGLTKFLFRRLDDHVSEHRLGEVFFAPLPIHLWEGQMREPDIVFLKSMRIKNRRKPSKGADLAMEIVSPGKESRQRDLKEKRRAYAKAKIPEYWIVDPKEQTITVLTLGARSYKVHGKFKPGDKATSKLLPSFTIDVAEAFAAGLGK